RRLDPAGDVHRVADGGQLYPPRVAQVGHDDLAEVDADADLEGRGEQAAQVVVEAGQLRDHVQRGPDGPGARPRRVGPVQAEQGHQAVADVLVDVAAVPQHRLAHALEVAVEDVDDVVGQVRLHEGRERADVAEED